MWQTSLKTIIHTQLQSLNEIGFYTIYLELLPNYWIRNFLIMFLPILIAFRSYKSIILIEALCFNIWHKNESLHRHVMTQSVINIGWFRNQFTLSQFIFISLSYQLIATEVACSKLWEVYSMECVISTDESSVCFKIDFWSIEHR